ncbi:MAG: hypothetical protein HYY18_18365 [Planctomycetes bacterium]|nr:hypothetical protein [Planctomycetota bacterium]
MKRAALGVMVAVIVAGGLFAGRRASGEDPPAKPKARFALVYGQGEKWVKGKSIYEQPLMEHGKYMGSLLKDGSMLLAGPFEDSTGGLAIVECADVKAAQAIVDADPAVKDKVLKAEVHEWNTVFDKFAK